MYIIAVGHLEALTIIIGHYIIGNMSMENNIHPGLGLSGFTVLPEPVSAPFQESMSEESLQPTYLQTKFREGKEKGKEILHKLGVYTSGLLGLDRNEGVTMSSQDQLDAIKDRRIGRRAGPAAGVAAIALIAAMNNPGSANANVEETCFNVDGQERCVDQAFEDAYNQFGGVNEGLSTFGYPIGPATMEKNSDTGQIVRTQYFERNRMEDHQENAPPYDVLLGRLGADALAKQGRIWQQFPKADPSAPNYYEETGHAIASWALPTIQSKGLELGDRGVSERESRALWGLPLSESVIETNSSGDTVETQWFERARLERHIIAGNSKVLLGLLGNEINGNQESRTDSAYPAVIGDLSSESFALYNNDQKYGFANGAGENNWDDLKRFKDEFAPNEKIAIYTYGPDDVDKLPQIPPGVPINYDTLIHYPNGEVGQQRRILGNDGVWSWHITLQSTPNDEVSLKNDTSKFLLGTMIFIVNKDQPGKPMPQGANKYLREFMAVPPGQQAPQFPLQLRVNP